MSGASVPLHISVPLLLHRCISLILWQLCVTHAQAINPPGANADSSSRDTLRYAALLYRHGDRSPTRTYSTDPHQETAWPQGFGQLTQIGMRQEYELGQYFKQRYIDGDGVAFLNPVYNHSEIYVRSTDFDRTIMSAQTVLSAMYPPMGSSLWNPAIQWQPIPVHLVPQEEDWLLNKGECTKSTPIVLGPDILSELQQFDASHQDLLTLLQANTGDNLTSLTSYGYVADALYCEERNNMTWPEWVPQDLVQTFHEEIGPFHQSFNYRSVQGRRQAGGSLVKHIIDEMENHLSDESPRKLSMHSAHDSTIDSLLGALGLYNNRTVPYSCAVMLELHSPVAATDTSGYFVRIWLRNNTEHPGYQLQLPGCDLECAYEQFVSLMQPVLPVIYSATDCSSLVNVFGWQFDFSQLITVVMISVGVGVAVFMVLMLVVVSCCKRRCRRRKIKRYGRMRNDGVPEELPMMATLGGGSDQED